MKNKSSTVAAQIRRHLANEAWEWRHKPATDRGSEILKVEYAKAQTWLSSIREAVGLPIGNGINGRWNIVPHISEDGFFGVVNIAEGIAIEYDLKVPNYVTRFGMDLQTSHSSNMAGGSGGKPKGWSRIILSISGVPAKKILSPRVTRVTWGFKTCYGSVGTDRREDASFQSRTRPDVLAAQWKETEEPQKEEIPFGMGVQKKLWEEFEKSQSYRSLNRGLQRSLNRISLSGGHYVVNAETLQYVHFYGTRADREKWIPLIRDAFRKFAVESATNDLLRKLSWNSFRIPNDFPRENSDSKSHKLGEEIKDFILRALSDGRF